MTSYANQDKLLELVRTGLRPLRFNGRSIATSTGADALPGRYESAKRWHDISVYETADLPKRYVAHVKFNTHWEGEPPKSAAHVSDDLIGIAEFLEHYDPGSDVLGMPPSNAPKLTGIAPDERQKQERAHELREERRQYIIRSIEMRFRNQVSELLASLPGLEVGIDEVVDPINNPRFNALVSHFKSVFREVEDRGLDEALSKLGHHAAYLALVSPVKAISLALDKSIQRTSLTVFPEP